MIEIVGSNERYHFANSWLSTYWHFSFDHYYDPKNMNFGPLRVFNDDTIAPGGGFPMHSHKEMEILTYVISGELEHRDSRGHRGVIQAGEVQRMSAGTGISHSEFNPSSKTPVHLLQIWVIPAASGLEPSWEQKSFPPEARRDRLLPVVSGENSPGALQIHQDATVYVSELASGKQVEHRLGRSRRAYLFVISGTVELDGNQLRPGDVAKVTEAESLRLTTQQLAHLILLVLP